MDTSKIYNQIYELPKVDLHRHIDGAVKPDLVLKLAEKYGIKIPSASQEEFRKLYTINPKNNEPLTITELFKRFAWTIGVMRIPEGLREVAYHQVLDLAEENIVYAELRFAPGYHSKYPAPFYDPKEYEETIFPVLSLEEVMNNIIYGLEKGMKETGIHVNLTLSIPRESQTMYGMDSALEIAKLAIKYQNKGVTAIDLACDEFTYPPGPYATVFQKTIGSTIRRDPHAGEMGTDEQRLENIKTCIFDLNANGLGHAIPLWKNKELVEHIKSSNVRIERNPWTDSSVRGIGEDGTDYLLKENVCISICSDDPILMEGSLTENFIKVINKYSWTEKDLHKIIFNAVNSGFYRSSEQEKAVKEFFKQQNSTHL
ncbi:MAG: hypothetical protein WC916_00935 [Candidatus Woesearchaeota archaeon]